ncbi:hypothetical protein HMPREF9072_00441 [Capnocytophaga sp. oral taxon 324 str. F0483]|nr:hypothetical protein HMPREF9072_00441 [Capnocytophaga sp. oral taxon 324 str. F0483]
MVKFIILKRRKNGVNAKAEGERVDFDFSDDFLKQFAIKIVPLHFQNKIV